MNDKSYVTMEQKVCLVCTKTFDTGSLLLDTRMRDSFDTRTVTGWDLCPEHQKLYDDGYVALVAADRSKSELADNGNVKDPGSAWRTGVVAHLRASVWPRIFGSEAPKNADGKLLPMTFCEPSIIEMLEKIPTES